MGTLQQQLQRAEKLNPQHLVDIIFNFLASIEAELASLNKDQIYKSSIDIFGNPLGYYSRATEYITTNDALLGKGTRIKKEGDPYDFLQYGEFLKGVYAKASKGFVTFGSSDPKTDDILSNIRLLSKSFFGLTDEHKIEVIQNKIKPHLLKATRLELGV
ncbi:hypothetical protein [uncultured Wocania sp.]|uniref:hypothetical protein n=1 Tax=uncultured Wocania sp. TaxID=2834404 RepID=UPI0030FA9DE4